MTPDPARVLVSYWGRRGSLPQFTYEVAKAAVKDPKITATISVSRQNTDFMRYLEFGKSLMPINTFQSNPGALLRSYRIRTARRKLFRWIIDNNIQLVIELMPHVWSHAIMPVVHRAGARYATIIHDFTAHPGDFSASAKPLLDRVIPLADVVNTLSVSVSDAIIASKLTASEKVFSHFHPDLEYGPIERIPFPHHGNPLRLLFLGRIMRYKGLDLFLDTIDQLRADDIPIEFGVYGEGALGKNAERLERMGGEVVNRWLNSREIADALSAHHLVILSHVEASQSGIAAAAFGAGVPVVSTPVGGLTEQVIKGTNGLIAENVSAVALADAVKHFYRNPDVYRRVQANLIETRAERSMSRFVSNLVDTALRS